MVSGTTHLHTKDIGPLGGCYVFKSNAFQLEPSRQISLEEILEMSPRDSYPLFFDQLDITPLWRAVSKNAVMGAPARLNYSAMIYSVFIRVIERIPTIKDLRRRLKNSLEFRFDCGFTMADSVPSESSYTRMIQKIPCLCRFRENPK